MAIYKIKRFSFFDKLKNIFSNNESQKQVTKNQVSSSTKRSIQKDIITFEEGYNKDYYPALVVIGIKSDKSLPNDGWDSFIEYFRKNGLFKKGGSLIGIHELSKKDNVNGENGSNVVVLEFDKDTEIDSGTRLMFRDYIKWPEDFFCTYNQFYTWYKSGKNIK